MSFNEFENDTEEMENVIVDNEITRNMSQTSSVTMPLQNKKVTDDKKKINIISIHEISKRFPTDIAVI